MEKLTKITIQMPNIQPQIFDAVEHYTFNPETRIMEIKHSIKVYKDTLVVLHLIDAFTITTHNYWSNKS